MAKISNTQKELTGMMPYDLPGSEHDQIPVGQFLSGFKLAERNYYTRALLEQVPSIVTDHFIGIGNPFLLGALPRGATVADVYSSGGMDAFIASRLVGPTGKVYGAEMSGDIVNRLIATTEFQLSRNLTFLHTLPDHLPLPDSMADIVISNGAMNLQTDIKKAFGEIYRILKPGGRIQMADAILSVTTDVSLQELFDSWTRFDDTSSELKNYRRILVDNGFREIEFSRFWPVLIRGRKEERTNFIGNLGGHIRALK